MLLLLLVPSLYKPSQTGYVFFWASTKLEKTRLDSGEHETKKHVCKNGLKLCAQTQTIVCTAFASSTPWNVIGFGLHKEKHGLKNQI